MFKVGDKVKCIRNGNHEKLFTIGKTYIVVEFKNYGNSKEWNSIADDKGHLKIVNHPSFEDFFEIVQEKATPPKKSAGWGF